MSTSLRIVLPYSSYVRIKVKYDTGHCKGLEVLHSHNAIFQYLILILVACKLVQSTLFKSDTFGAGTKCPSKRDVRL